MSEQILRLKVEDYDEMIDFLNLVFSQSGPIDFERLLPKLYRPVEELTKCNYAIKKDGKIRAVVGLFPMTLNAGGNILKVGGIGGVSTHKKFREAGLMRRLMEACIAEMQAEGYHLSCLGGLRQRYAYYGYEKAGSVLHYNVSMTNIKHCFRNATDFGLTFKPIKESDSELLAQCKRLHDAQPIHVERSPENFYLDLVSWHAVPWAAFDGKGNLVGYLVANDRKNDITEILVFEPEQLVKMAAAWINTQDIYSVNITLPPWAYTYARLLEKIAESTKLDQAYNWRVFDWIPVISSLLHVKSTLTSLTNGAINFGIEDYGTIRIEVSNGNVRCERTQAAPDFECSSAMAHRIILGPQPVTYITQVPDKLALLFASWFPLPLSWPSPDGV